MISLLYPVEGKSWVYMFKLQIEHVEEVFQEENKKTGLGIEMVNLKIILCYVCSKQKGLWTSAERTAKSGDDSLKFNSFGCIP